MKALFGKKVGAAKVVVVKVIPVPKKKAAPKKTVVKKVAVKKASTPKAAPNKVAVKKAVTKKTANEKKRLVVASDSESFWMSDGQVLNSLIALETALKSMKLTVYTYHVNKDGNHFADWAEAVLGDTECAKALRGAKTASAAYKVVVTHTKLYTS